MDKEEQLSIINTLNNNKVVDKSVDKPKKEETYRDMKPLNKVKVLTIPVDKSFIEGNLIDIPFICYFRTKEPTTVVEFVWTDSKGIKRKIEVRGSGKWGVPDEYCFDVLTALFRIYQKQNQGIRFNYDKNKWGMDKIIHFTFSELAREMGYKSFGKNNFEKIDTALEILNDTTIYNKSGACFFDAKTKKYFNTESKESIGIIKNYRSYRYSKLKTNQKRIDYRQIRDVTSVTLDDFIYQSLCNSYFKIFNYDQYSQLKIGISKKIFLLLSKWRAERKKVFLKWETLYQRIPLRTADPKDEKPDKYKKRRIRDACKELINIGFIEEFHDNTIGVEFIFKDGKDETCATCINDEYNTIPQIIEGLKAADLNYDDMQKLLNSTSIDKLKKLLININDFDKKTKKRILLESIE